MIKLEELEKDYNKIIIEHYGNGIKVVFGQGDILSKILLVGEAPGKKEEELGKPFVGSAGKNLDEFLKILNIKRDDIYITNVVKIRPFKINKKTGRKSNRPPTTEEIEISINTLEKQIEVIKPIFIVTLGNVPLKVLTNNKDARIGDWHGKPIEMKSFTLFPLYHPASIIYRPSLYLTYINDISKLKNLIGGELS